MQRDDRSFLNDSSKKEKGSNLFKKCNKNNYSVMVVYISKQSCHFDILKVQTKKM